MSKPGKELYVGSLSFDVTDYDLEKLFAVSGTVTSVHLICDNKTGEFKGCGYVRMSTEAEAKDAIASLDGAMLIDRRITVSIANPQKVKAPGGYKGKAPGAPTTGAGKPAAGKSGAAAAKPGARAASAKPAVSKKAVAKAAFAAATDHPLHPPKKKRPSAAKPGPSKAGKR
jgi:RNA recognition motif-containing protein